MKLIERRQLMQQNQQDTAAAADDDNDDDDNEDDDEDGDEDEITEDEQQNDEPAMVVPRPRRKTVNVGSAAVLDCDVEYPTAAASQRYVQNIVTWRKQGVEAPVFIAFDGYPPRVDSTYLGRVRAVGPAAIEIDDVRTSDEGWYECTVLFIDHDDESPGNGTWTYLAVNSTSTLHHLLPLTRLCFIRRLFVCLSAVINFT